MKGSVGQTTIAQADIAQSLVTAPLLVRSFIVVPDGANSGDFTVSYGGAPLLPSLGYSAEGNSWYDLAMVQVKSTVAGDKANFNYIYAP